MLVLGELNERAMTIGWALCCALCSQCAGPLGMTFDCGLSWGILRVRDIACGLGAASCCGNCC